MIPHIFSATSFSLSFLSNLMCICKHFSLCLGLRPLYENPAMFMLSLLISSHLSLVPCLYPLPWWEHSSVSSTTKEERWRALGLLLVVLKGTPSPSSADGADSFIPPEQQVGQSTEGTKTQTKQKHARTLGKKTKDKHNHKESSMCIFLTHWSSRSFCSWGRNL